MIRKSFLLSICVFCIFSDNAFSAVSRDKKDIDKLSPDRMSLITKGLKSVIILKSSFSEKLIRKLIAKAIPKSVFIIEHGASWTLTSTLVIPDQTTIIGFDPGKSSTATFIKGFNGTLATVGSWVTLHGLIFNGNKKEFTGDGLTDPKKGKKGVREQRFIRVEVRNCAGNGFVFTKPHYYSYYQFCSFDRNDGYGLVYGEIKSHHTDNLYDSCHWGWNGKGAVAFHAVEASSVWENCEFFHNGGAAFEHFLINKKLGNGRPIGPRPGVGAGALVIRNSVIRNHAGPVWLNRGGKSEAIVFQDCRIKHNVNPKNCAIIKKSGKTTAQLMGLTDPVGMLHCEKGQLFAELRGGFCRDNGKYLFTAVAGSIPGSRITIGGSCSSGHLTGGVHAPTGYATILDASLLKAEVEIIVKSGIGLDPVNGKVIKYGIPDKASNN